MASFPKLITSNSQHTTIETPSVRYIYQPLDEHYLLLLTNLQSNILQDLSTLHLLARIFADVCHGNSKKEVKEKVFDLADAFDEVIGLGYRENVNLQKVKTCLEMDSHEEKIQEIIAKNKEKEVKEEGKRKAKILDQQRREQMKKTTSSGGLLSGSFGAAIGGFAGNVASSMKSATLNSSGAETVSYQEYEKPQYIISFNCRSSESNVVRGKGKGMKLGKKQKTAEMMSDLNMEAAVSEQEQTTSISQKASVPVHAPVESSNREQVHVEIDEKFVAVVNRDGGLDNLEVKGSLVLTVSSAEYSKIKLLVTPSTESDVQFKVHFNPNFSFIQIWTRNSGQAITTLH